jgi:hypothetical protein
VAEALTRPRALADLGGQRAALQQKDNLCGPFQAARVLRDAGITSWDGEELDQDLIALRAGTVLPEVEEGPQVPPGAVNFRDYRFDLPRAAPAEAGTSAGGLAEAIEAAAGRVGEAIEGPLGDTYASGEYRSHLASVLTKRALALARERAGG